MMSDLPADADGGAEGNAPPPASERSPRATPKLHLKSVAVAVKPWWSLDKMAAKESQSNLLDTRSLTLLDKVYAGSPRAPHHPRSLSKLHLREIRAIKLRVLGKHPGQGSLEGSLNQKGPVSDEDREAAEEKREMKRENDKKMGIVVHAFEILEKLLAQEAQSGDAEPDEKLASALCDVLYAFPFFQHFDDTDVVQLAKLCEPLRVPKGSTLYVQDDEHEDSVFFVLHGAISVHYHPSHSAEKLRTNADAWALICNGRENNAAGRDVEDLFGPEVAVEGVGSCLGANCLLDERLMRHKPSGTGLL